MATKIYIDQGHNPENPNAKNGISAPERDGYEFIGWALSPDAFALPRSFLH